MRTALGILMAALVIAACSGSTAPAPRTFSGTWKGSLSVGTDGITCTSNDLTVDVPTPDTVAFTGTYTIGTVSCSDPLGGVYQFGPVSGHVANGEQTGDSVFFDILPDSVHFAGEMRSGTATGTAAFIGCEPYACSTGSFTLKRK